MGTLRHMWGRCGANGHIKHACGEHMGHMGHTCKAHKWLIGVPKDTNAGHTGGVFNTFSVRHMLGAHGAHRHTWWGTSGGTN